MYIRLHGGYCCGIKHIHNMGDSPNNLLDSREALSGKQTSFGRHSIRGINDGHPEKYPEDYFNEAAPQEKASERLKRLIAFLKLHRPHGIIEIVLTSQQHLWYSTLKRLGFVKVSEAINSNTGNSLRVFHLSY